MGHNNTLMPRKPNNHCYQNFCTWSKGEFTEEDFKAAGGKREWNKAQWSQLWEQERAAPDAPWNDIACTRSATTSPPVFKAIMVRHAVNNYNVAKIHGSIHDKIAAYKSCMDLKDR